MVSSVLPSFSSSQRSETRYDVCFPWRLMAMLGVLEKEVDIPSAGCIPGPVWVNSDSMDVGSQAAKYSTQTRSFGCVSK